MWTLAWALVLAWYVDLWPLAGGAKGTTWAEAVATCAARWEIPLWPHHPASWCANRLAFELDTSRVLPARTVQVFCRSIAKGDVKIAKGT